MQVAQRPSWDFDFHRALQILRAALSVLHIANCTCHPQGLLGLDKNPNLSLPFGQPPLQFYLPESMSKKLWTKMPDHTCPLGKWPPKSTCPTEKSASPRLLDMVLICGLTIIPWLWITCHHWNMAWERRENILDDSWQDATAFTVSNELESNVGHPQTAPGGTSKCMCQRFF